MKHIGFDTPNFSWEYGPPTPIIEHCMEELCSADSCNQCQCPCEDCIEITHKIQLKINRVEDRDILYSM